MSLYLHIPASRSPAVRVAAFNSAFGHPLPQVNARGETVAGIATKQLEDIPAANGDGVVLEVSTLFHLPDGAETAIERSRLYSLRSAVAAGIVVAPEGESLDPDLRTLTDALPHQSAVGIWREFPSLAEADAFLTTLGLTRADVEMRRDATTGAVAVRGYADEMPVAALDEPAELVSRTRAEGREPVENSRPPREDTETRTRSLSTESLVDLIEPTHRTWREFFHLN